MNKSEILSTMLFVLGFIFLIIISAILVTVLFSFVLGEEIVKLALSSPFVDYNFWMGAYWVGISISLIKGLKIILKFIEEKK